MENENKIEKEPRDNQEWGKVPEGEEGDPMVKLEKEVIFWQNKAEEQADEVKRQNEFIKIANRQLVDLLKYTISELVNR